MNIRAKHPMSILLSLALLVCAALLPGAPARAVGEFVDSGLPFPGLHYSASDWGDYDNDGDLDLALSGLRGDDIGVFKLYRNQGDGTFDEVPTTITPRIAGAVLWVDYNGDGWLDLFGTGETFDNGTNSGTLLYQNTGGTFSVVPNTPFAHGRYGEADWGDYDGDGDPDLLLAVNQSSSDSMLAAVYRNDGNNTFTTIQAGLQGIAWGAARWVDYDGDGQLDIFLTGCPDGDLLVGYSTRLYRGGGAGTWAEVTTPFAQVGRSSGEWGDYDNDGDLDLFLVGATRMYWDMTARLYQNQGDGTFQDSGASFLGVYQSMAQWGDYDGDGWLDLVVAGIDHNVNFYTSIYHNNRDGSFTNINAGVVPVSSGTVGWGDYDADGRLDLFVSGCDRVYCPSVSRLYRNALPGPPPTPTPSLPPGAVVSRLRLPLVGYTPVGLLLTINAGQIPAYDVDDKGQVFYRVTLRLPAPLPQGGRFYLSACPDDLCTTYVDDRVVLRHNGAAIFSHTYAEDGGPRPALVEVPASTLAPLAGKQIVVEFVDVYGDHVSATPMYLIWVGE